MNWPVNPLRGKANQTTDWRAVCGKSACTVRRGEGPNSIGPSYPYLPCRGNNRSTSLTAMWAWTTSAIVVLLGTIAFLLGCEQMFDTDIWWHVRSGEWILATRRVPWLDPFTFASSDRPWIDLHWGFQVAVALAHRLAGVPGILILAAMVSGTAFLVAFAA